METLHSEFIEQSSVRFPCSVISFGQSMSLDAVLSFQSPGEHFMRHYFWRERYRVGHTRRASAELSIFFLAPFLYLIIERQGRGISSASRQRTLVLVS